MNFIALNSKKKDQIQNEELIIILRSILFSVLVIYKYIIIHIMANYNDFRSVMLNLNKPFIFNNINETKGKVYR